MHLALFVLLYLYKSNPIYKDMYVYNDVHWDGFYGCQMKVIEMSWKVKRV